MDECCTWCCPQPVSRDSFTGNLVGLFFAVVSVVVDDDDVVDDYDDVVVTAAVCLFNLTKTLMFKS